MSDSNQILSPEHTTIRPRIEARDGQDLWVFLGTLLLLTVPTLILLFAVEWIVFRLSGNRAISMLVVTAILLAGHYWIQRSLVGALQIRAEGIALRKARGRTELIPWGEIDSIRPADRREVLIDGWLRRPFRPREATSSRTSLGHYRIAHGDQVVFFPPAFPDEFEAALQRWRGTD